MIYNIHFSVGLLHNTHFSVLLIRALFVRFKKRLASYSIRRRGRPSWARTSRHASPRQRIMPHTVTEVEVNHNNQCNPKAQDFPGSPHLDLQSAACAGAGDDSLPLMTVETFPRLPGDVRAARDSLQ